MDKYPFRLIRNPSFWTMSWYSDTLYELSLLMGEPKVHSSVKMVSSRFGTIFGTIMNGMEESIERYFNKEGNESSLFLCPQNLQPCNFFWIKTGPDNSLGPSLFSLNLRRWKKIKIIFGEMKKLLYLCWNKTKTNNERFLWLLHNRTTTPSRGNGILVSLCYPLLWYTSNGFW